MRSDSEVRAVALSRHRAWHDNLTPRSMLTGLECLLARSTTSRTARHATAPYTRVPFPLRCALRLVGPSP